MARKLDGGAVLRSMLDHPDAFPDIRADLDIAAEKALAKQLKAKALTLADCRKIAAAVGPQTFALALEGLPPATLKTLHTKLDKHHAEQEAGSDVARREHLLKLADGSVEPAAKTTVPATSAKTPKKAATVGKKKTAQERFLEHSAFQVEARAKPEGPVQPQRDPDPAPAEVPDPPLTPAQAAEEKTAAKAPPPAEPKQEPAKTSVPNEKKQTAGKVKSPTKSEPAAKTASAAPVETAAKARAASPAKQKGKGTSRRKSAPS